MRLTTIDLTVTYFTWHCYKELELSC